MVVQWERQGLGRRLSSASSRASAGSSTAWSCDVPYIPPDPSALSPAAEHLAQLTDPFAVVSGTTRSRLEGKARKFAAKIDVFRPSSADFGSNVSTTLGSGVRRATDVSHRSQHNPAHLATNLKMGEYWDPYAVFGKPGGDTPLRPTRGGSRGSKGPDLPFGMGFG